MNAAALLLPFVVALPHGAVAPPPGALPAAARVSVLDRELGLALVRLPKRGLAPSLRRLRAAPGVRSVERDAPLDLAAEGCNKLDNQEKSFPGWRTAIHLSTRSAAGMVIGMADSGVDDDRLAPREAPLLHFAAGGKRTPQDPLGHGTAVASILVANRPDVHVVGIVPDATLLSVRLVKSASCSQVLLEHSLVVAFAWLRRQGAQVVNVSMTAHRSPALVDSLQALQLSGALVVAAVGNDGVKPSPRFPASQPGVLGVGELAGGSSTQVAKESTRGTLVDLVAPAQGIRVIASGAENVSLSAETALTSPGTSFAAPIVTAAAAMVWATHRDWRAAEVANALVRSATPLPGDAVPSVNWGYGVLNVSRALRTERLPDSHEPNDWVAAALAQRPLRPGSVVVASLGWAGDTIDAYTVDVPAGANAQAVIQRGGRGLTMKVLSVQASEANLAAVARMRPSSSPIALPAGRSLLVVARRQGAGPYTLVLSGGG